MTNAKIEGNGSARRTMSDFVLFCNIRTTSSNVLTWTNISPKKLTGRNTPRLQKQNLAAETSCEHNFKCNFPSKKVHPKIKNTLIVTVHADGKSGEASQSSKYFWSFTAEVDGNLF